MATKKPAASTEAPDKEVIEELELMGQEAVDAVRGHLARIRTGRANLSVLDSIRVDYYGTKTPLNQMATLAVPDPRLITIKPYDKSKLQEIEKVLRASSDLGLQPQSDGEIIRLPIPPLTEERRRDLTKTAKSKAEEGKIAVRSARREANEKIKAVEKDGALPEDAAKKALERIQQLTDKFVKDVDDLVSKKEKEILEI
ncbi:MAG: ribosome recycling factor [Deltaproteobacteria bacterium]|nr:ribosome recycling factor [Deltaproteobacteria bacterium]